MGELLETNLLQRNSATRAAKLLNACLHAEPASNDEPAARQSPIANRQRFFVEMTTQHAGSLTGTERASKRQPAQGLGNIASVPTRRRKSRWHWPARAG
jgi:hypothetical protein